MDAVELHKKLYPEAAAKQEYIICAAIHFLDGKKHEHQPVNIESGIVICGRRHHNAIHSYHVLSGEKATAQDIQGFLTSKDRFVDRAEGGQIAFTAGQIPQITDCMFSEDLY